MRTKDLKSLAETISTVVEPIDDRSKLIAEGYLNSLTEKARQVSENEDKDKNADDIMAKLAAKALNRARKKARRDRPSGDAAYAGINPPAAATDPDMKNRGAVAEAYPTSYEPKPKPKPKKPRFEPIPKPKPHLNEVEAYPTSYEPKPKPKPKKPRFEPIPKPKPHLNEVAAPGYENWASDPKVKASFKKQYGKDWKQVMYGRSWNMAKMDEEVELAEGGDSAKRMRILRKGKPVKGAVADFMDRSFMKKFYKNKTRFGGETPAVLGRARLKHSAMKAKGLAEAEQLDEIIHLLKKHKKKIGAALVGAAVGAGAGVAAPHVRDHMSSNPVRTSLTDKVGLASHKESPSFRAGVGAALGAGAMMVGVRRRRVNEAEQLDEGKGGRSGFTNLMKRQVSRVRRAGGREDVQREIGNYTEREAAGGESKMSYQARRAFSDANIEARAKERDAKKAKARAAMKEQVLAEAGYKKLMRLKKAAYNKSLKARTGDPAAQDKFAKTKRAEAEQESKVATRMAMKGGASADAVRGGGNRRGKRGGFTAQAGKLANKREEGIRNFRNLNVDRGVARDTEIGTVQAITNRVTGKKPQMTPAQVARKRKDQAAMRDFRNRERSGDFGQNNQEGMRPRYNYLKRTGQLKTRRK